MVFKLFIGRNKYICLKCVYIFLDPLYLSRYQLYYKYSIQTDANSVNWTSCVNSRQHLTRMYCLCGINAEGLPTSEQNVTRWLTSGAPLCAPDHFMTGSHIDSQSLKYLFSNILHNSEQLLTLYTFKLINRYDIWHSNTFYLHEIFDCLKHYLGFILFLSCFC